MSRRILGIELRRSDAARVAALVAVLGATFVYLGAPRGWWMVLAVHQRDTLGLLWPLALGAGAWQARRDRRSRIEELLSATPRPRWQRAAPTAVAMAIGIVVGYLAMSASGAATLRPVSSYFPATYPTTVAVGTLSMVAAVWLGLAAGRALPSALTPPILALAGVVVVLVVPEFLYAPTSFGGSGPGVLLLAPSVTVARGYAEEFFVATTRAHLIQAVWLCALAAAGLLAFAAGFRGRLVATGSVLASLVVVVPMLPTDLSSVVTRDERATAYVCTSDTPRVCVTRVHQAALADLRDPARQALDLLLARLPAAPTSVFEDRGAPRPADAASLSARELADAVIIELPVRDTGRVARTPEQLRWMLLAGAGSRPCPGPGTGALADQVMRHYSARLAVAAWLLAAAPTVLADEPWADRDLANDALSRLRTYPPDEQAARVADLRAAELACEGRDRLDILTGPTRPR